MLLVSVHYDWRCDCHQWERDALQGTHSNNFAQKKMLRSRGVGSWTRKSYGEIHSLLIRTKRTVQRIRRHQFGAVYSVSALDLRQEFEVLADEAA